MSEKLREAVATQLMAQAQVFASAWSLVGGPFDDGSALVAAEEAKVELSDMITAALTQLAHGEVPVLYMAVNLHNRKHYATSRSKEEAELYLIQSGLKNDGQEAAVIALYEHVAPQCGIGDGRAEFEAYAYQMGSRDFELNEFGGYKNSHTADKWWFWKSSRDELKIRFAAAPQPPADTIAVPVEEWATMQMDLLIMYLREYTNFDADLVEAMLKFAIDAAKSTGEDV